MANTPPIGLRSPLARPSARDLLGRARAEQKHAAGVAPIIRGVEPSRAAWGEAIVVRGEFAPKASLQVALRVGADVFPLAVGTFEGGRVSVTLPAAPDGSADAVLAELIVVVARQPSRPCRLAIFTGPVLRRVTRSGEAEWLLHGTGFGSSLEDVRLSAPGSQTTQVLSVSNTEIRVRAVLSARAPIRVRVGDRVSNVLQARA